jgi:hypothetical protein
MLLNDELRDNLSMGTTSGREFLPRDVYLPTYSRNAPRGRAIFERLYPEAEWPGILVQPLAGDLRLITWRNNGLSLAVRVANDGGQPGALALHQARFPGWRAWLDGARVPIEAAPYVQEQQASAGFMVVSVPPGEHTVSLAFGPTPVHLIGTAVTALSILGAAGALAWLLRTNRGWPRALLAATWVALAAALAYLSWREIRPAFGRFAPAPPEPQVVDGIWSAPDLAARGAGLVVNVAEAARTGHARVGSPYGPRLGPDEFVDVRQLTVTDTDDPERGVAGTSRRQWLYLHPPSNVGVDVAIPRRPQVWFQASLALDPAVWEAPVGDGVRFQVQVAPLSVGGDVGPATVVVDQAINPRAKTEQRRWVAVEADLSRWGGSTVRLTLSTLPGDDVTFDWAGWANPVVVVADTARAHPSLIVDP